MLKLKSNDIKDFPFEAYANLNTAQAETLAKDHCLTSYNGWMLPQIMAHYARWELKRDENGMVDCEATAKHNITTAWDIGLWRVVTRLKRGSLVKAQSHPEFVNYSALVPIILMAQKRFNGVLYRNWKITPNCNLVDKSLLDAMLLDTKYEVTPERLLEIRTQGLTTKSGPRAGSVAKATAQWKLNGIGDTELSTIPALAGTMLCQIWVAHPSLRTEYMVLDPYNWDRMPPSLIATEIFPQKEVTKKVKKEDQNPDMPF